MNYGLIGTGLMGFPMAMQLLKAGLTLSVFNRTREKAQPLIEHGATISSTPGDVLAAADCVLLMLTDTAAIRSTILSEDARPHLAHRTIIQMGTITPSESRILAEEIQAVGGEYLEAPVLGSIPQVKDGSLIVMVGATEQQFADWRSLLQVFGPEPTLVGPVGTAMALKLAMNQLIAGLTNAFALSLGFVQRQGVDTDTFMDVVRGSALYAPTFDKKLSRMLDRNFDNPNFPSKHLAKDIGLFLQEAKDCDLMTDSLSGVQSVVERAISLGLSNADYSALYEAVNPESPD
ncbi:MAG: NAD(P)-dependent oxidoreductase [Cyanobacteria bacterium P01_E01_bin.45]